jgi:hypothetical protein
LLPYEVRRGIRGDYWVWVCGLGSAWWRIFALVYARRTLLTEFRELATQRFQPKPGWWQRF